MANQVDAIPDPRTLADDELLTEVQRLVSAERRATAALLRALMELDARRLYLREGCASLFTYCTTVLHLSEGAAYNRIEVARLARRCPAVLQAIAQGEVTLTAARLLAPHVTDANCSGLLAAARHRSRREVEELVATLHPRPDAPTVVRRLAAADVRTQARGPSASAGAASSGGADSRGVVGGSRDADGPGDAAPPGAADARPEGNPPCEPLSQTTAQPRTIAPPRPEVIPLAPERYRLQLTLSSETHAKLRRAQDLLRSAVPGGDLAEILDRALTLLLQNVERQRFAATTAPRGARAADGSSRHVPASVRRVVWQRDAGRCAFVGRAGRCRETDFLEFHHVTPFAVGGPATEANIQLRCRAHNAYEAELFFGAGGSRVREEASRWDVERVPARARSPGVRVSLSA